MQHLDLKEWAEALRLTGDSQISDFGREVLALIDLEDRREYLEQVAETLTIGIRPRIIPDTDRAAEWLVDRNNLLEEMEELLDAFAPGKGGAMALEELLDEWDKLRVQNAAIRAPEVVEYDL